MTSVRALLGAAAIVLACSVSGTFAGLAGTLAARGDTQTLGGQFAAADTTCQDGSCAATGKAQGFSGHPPSTNMDDSMDTPADLKPSFQCLQSTVVPRSFQQPADLSLCARAGQPHTIHVVAVAGTEETSYYSLRRFLRSADVQGLADTTHIVADVAEARKALQQLASDDAAANVVMVVSADESILTGTPGHMLESFCKAAGADQSQVLVPCKAECLSQTTDTSAMRKSMASSPLCPVSSSMVGYADTVLALLASATSNDVADALSDAVAMNPKTVVADVDAKLFGNLQEQSSLSDQGFYIDFVSRGHRQEPQLFYAPTGTTPSVAVDSRASTMLMQVGNYVPLGWSHEDGCIHCRQMQTCIERQADLPVVSVMLQLGAPSAPFLSFVLADLAGQHYPKSRIDLTALVSPATASSDDWLAFEQQFKSQYRSFKTVVGSPGQETGMSSLKTAANNTLTADNALLFVLDHSVRLTNPDALWHMATLDVDMVAPKLTRQGKFFSNFWGDAKRGSHFEHGVSLDMEYVRSADYFNVVQRTRRSLFAAPLVFGAFMLRGQAALQAAMEAADLGLARTWWETCLTLSQHMVNAGIQPHVSNLIHYGHLLDVDNAPTNRAHPELYLLEENPAEWEKLYINKEYNNFKQHGFIEGCNDIFRVPMFSPRFAADLIAECEYHGGWSAGSNKDERLQGGYEPVPTQDIHLNQLGLDHVWYLVLTQYLRPVAGHHYQSYTIEGRRTLDFVVRYRPDRQASLKPHHDASTVTLNVALNQGGVDYQGGGTRFLRQNCTLLDTPPGWGTLSPGRLTHLHEGLETTEGTRYILVSFIDQ